LILEIATKKFIFENEKTYHPHFALTFFVGFVWANEKLNNHFYVNSQSTMLERKKSKQEIEKGRKLISSSSINNK